MSRRTLLLLALTSALLVSPSADARPDAFVTRQAQLTGRFLRDTTTYLVRVTYRERFVLSVGDYTNPQGGFLTLNPNEISYLVMVCKATGCELPGDMLCSTTTSGIVQDRYQTISVDSTATSCPVSFTATISGYGVPRVVGAAAIILDANAAFAPGATLLTQSATGSNGIVNRTLLGVAATP